MVALLYFIIMLPCQVDIMYLKNLVKIRKKIGWSQEKLAAESGVSYSTLIKIESGRIDNPRIGTVMNFAKALKVSIDDLVK